MPDCKTCENAKIVIGFEEDPICKIRDGFECAHKKTYRSYKFNNNKVSFVKGGLKALLSPISELGDVYITEKGKKKL